MSRILWLVLILATQAIAASAVWSQDSSPVPAIEIGVTEMADAEAVDPEMIDTELAAAEAVAAELAESPPSGWNRGETLLASLTIFVLAVFVGFEVITKVPPTLHTPLMSGSNAISGITLVGAMLAVGRTTSNRWVPVLGTLAVILATVNVVGGFAVTHRMSPCFVANNRWMRKAVSSWTPRRWSSWPT